MKKLALIQSSQLGIHGTPHKMRRGICPPLALPYVAALTPPGYEITLLDDFVQDIDFDEDFDVVGITAQTSQVERAYQIGDKFRSRGIPVILGGPHATLCADEAEGKFDAIVVGEAEEIWEKVLKDAESGNLQSRYSASGLADLSKMPTPRYDLINPRTVQ